MAAVKHRLPTGAAFSGFTAVWRHGLDKAFRNPIEITVPAPSSVTTRAGIVVRRRALEAVDVVRIHELPVASVRRTLHDVAALLSLTESVVLADRALHLGRIKRDQLLLGNRLPRIAEFVEPLSESPMETRLRMLPVLAGLPRPQAQVPIRNRFFKVIARVDLYYPEARLGLEYDGATHKDSIAADDRRQNLLTAAGVRLLRFTASDIYNSPELVVSQIRAELKRSA